MRVKSRVLVGLIVLIVLVSGVSLVKRLSQEKDLWRPSDVYKSVGIHRRSTFSTVSSAPASYSEAVATVSSGSGSMFRHSGASFHAPVSGSAYSQSSMAGTASYSQSPIAYSQRLHTTSSAEIRSFGGGGNGGGVSMSGGAVQSSGSSVASSAGLNVSMPSTSVLAVNNNRNNSSVNDVMSSVSGDIAMASSQAYAGIGNTTRGIGGRKNVPGIAGSEWTGWLDTEWEGGSDDITFDMLKDLYVRMTGDTDFSNEELWNSFLAWFEGNQTNDKFGWYWAPISDAVPFVLLLCLVYAFVIYRKTKMAKNVKAEK